MSINHSTLSGNLTHDAELRHSEGGVAILSFGLAFNDRRKQKDSDEWEDVVNFIDCTLFGNRAEALEPYLLKGTKVCLDGKLRWGQWETGDGDKRSKIELIVDELEFMAPRRDEDESADPPKKTKDN